MIKMSKDTVWECIDYQWKKFPFNFHCKCQTTVSDPNDPTYILIYDLVNTSDKPEYSIIDVNDINLKKITIQSNFKYVQNHDFHKLTQEMDSKKCFTSISNNICSVCANLEDLELIIANLDRTFDIRGVSETNQLT